MPTMDAKHCAIAVTIMNLRDSAAADKRRYNVFFICLSSLLNDGAKIQNLFNPTKKNDKS